VANPTPSPEPAASGWRAGKKIARGTNRGLKLFPWRRIEETGSMMLQRGNEIQFFFEMPTIITGNTLNG
jgi:hypothetical protein